jgi:glycosyltransferase involved in cell wall biosynthesis
MLCAHASTAAYVTESALQARYPCGGTQLAVSDVELVGGPRFTTHYSSVELHTSDFAAGCRKSTPGGPLRLITVASLAQRYKGVDVLIEAVDMLSREGIDCSLGVIGDGRYRGELEEQARRSAAPVEFLGHLQRADVLRAMDQASLFVLGSRTEGLPRALIEAMARGLPCIATRVGGIPELLDDEALVPPGSAQAFYGKLKSIVDGQVDVDGMAERNLTRAADFRAEILRERRRTFYRGLRLQTERWLAQADAA